MDEHYIHTAETETTVQSSIQKNLLTLLYNNNHAAFYLNTKFKIVKVNNIVERIFNCPSNQLAGQSLFDVLNQYNNSIITSLNTMLKEKSSDALQTNEYNTANQSEKRSKYSKMYQWSLIESIDIKGRQNGFILTGYDMTTHMRRLEDYKQISNFLKTLLTNMPHYVFWKDTNLVYLGCNKNFADLMEIGSPDKIIGKTFYSLSPHNNLKESEGDDKQIIHSNKPIIDKEMLLTLPNGKRITISITKVPIQDQNQEVLGVLAVFTDITDQKQMEQKLLTEKQQVDTANQATSDFLAGMSHDLRTPLNSIIVSAQFLQTNRLQEGQEELITAISKSAKILLHLVEDILNFTKIETGQIELHADYFDLRQTAEEVVGMMAHKALEKKIDLIISYNEFVPRHVIGDSFCFHRIIINMLDNAIKFTSSGYVLIKFDGNKITEDKAMLRITVEDTGIGIEEDRLDFIFERFTRIEPAYKGRYKGSGLGLAIVKELIKKMDGEIQVKSNPKHGSKFIISLPFSLQNIGIRYSLWYRHYSNLSVLIVDDQRMRGQIILKQIATNRSKLVNSDKILDELNAISSKHQSYDIILIDNQIKSINALKLAHHIRSNHCFKNTMLVYITNACSLSSSNAAKEAGFFIELIKPIKPSELINTLGNSWGKWLSTYRGKDYLMSTLNPIVLTIESDLFMQKIIKLMLNEFGYISDVYTTYSKEIIFSDQSYDMIILDIDSTGKEHQSIIKMIRKYEDKNNPIPIIILGDKLKKKDEMKLLELGVNYFISKPIDHVELKQTLLRSLFPKENEQYD